MGWWGEGFNPSYVTAPLRSFSLAVRTDRIAVKKMGQSGDRPNLSGFQTQSSMPAELLWQLLTLLCLSPPPLPYISFVWSYKPPAQNNHFTCVIPASSRSHTVPRRHPCGLRFPTESTRRQFPKFDPSASFLNYRIMGIKYCSLDDSLTPIIKL